MKNNTMKKVKFKNRTKMFMKFKFHISSWIRFNSQMNKEHSNIERKEYNVPGETSK